MMQRLHFDHLDPYRKKRKENTGIIQKRLTIIIRIRQRNKELKEDFLRKFEERYTNKKHKQELSYLIPVRNEVSVSGAIHMASAIPVGATRSSTRYLR